MATTEKYLLGAVATLMGAELNALASSAALSAGAIASTLYDNTQGAGGGDGFASGDLELSIGALAAAAAAGSAAFVWFLRDPDGSNFEDGSASVVPARAPDAIIPLRAVAVAQRVTVPAVAAPAGQFKALLGQNTGQALAATGNTLKWRPFTRQAV